MSNKETKPKKKTKKELVIEIFQPDKNGFSKWKTREELSFTKLKLGDNGNIRKGIFHNDNYNWEIKRLNNNLNGKVLKIRTVGFNKDKLNKNRPISTDIKKVLLEKNKKCIHCGISKNLCIDHKNDFYNDARVLNSKTQTIDDFQVLCNKCNKDLKHQDNVKEKKNKKLFSAKELGTFPFLMDDFEYPWEKKVFDEKDPNCKKDTYWYDIKEFHIKRELYIQFRLPINKMIKRYFKEK